MDNRSAAKDIGYVTVVVAGQAFGLPVMDVRDAFVPTGMTRVPVAAAAVAGILNLRGTVLTAIDMRSRLGMSEEEAAARRMAVSVVIDGENYALLVDSVGEVVTLAEAAREPNPMGLDRLMAGMADGVYRMDGSLFVALDVNRVIGGMRLAA